MLAGPRGAVVDDFVVWREGRGDDQTAAYNLAVVVDDADQGVGEVVRGDDLLETTPRQIVLAGALGLAVPRYAHAPLGARATGGAAAAAEGGGDAAGALRPWRARREDRRLDGVERRACGAGDCDQRA